MMRLPASAHQPKAKDESGQMTLMVIGFAVILMMAVALVVDSSAAYLQRQGLATLADGAALAGADGGAEGAEVYGGGLDGPHADLVADSARSAIRDYLIRHGASGKYPGLDYAVTIGVDTIQVRIQAPIELPLTIPGSPDKPQIAATGSAVVTIDR